ncbi:MAG: glycosyltransferase [Thermoplasmata archaeon]
METLNIALVSTNTYSTPPGGFTGGAYGGEVSIWHLAQSLGELGHRVTLFATPSSLTPPGGDLYYMRSSYGTSTPWFWECEQEIYDRHRDKILRADVIQDFSHTKKVAENLYNRDRRTNVVSTLIGSVWNHPVPPYNVIVWTEQMRQMGLHGWTGYEQSPWENAPWNTKTGQLKDAHVVNGGTDTDFYAFEPNKQDYFLWYSRFHPSKGYHIAIDLAKRTGIPLVLMGDHPKDAPSPDHRAGALEAIELAKGADNIRFEWLPRGAATRGEMKRKWIQGAKALLYTIDFQECFGLVVVETLSCGTPVITTNRGAMPELIRHGKTGFVCNLENGLNDFILATSNADKIRPEDCRRDAVERFDRKVMARAYVEEYRKVMNGAVWGV